MAIFGSSHSESAADCNVNQKSFIGRTLSFDVICASVSEVLFLLPLYKLMENSLGVVLIPLLLPCASFFFHPTWLSKLTPEKVAA